ncbi:UNVERIFIED_CONTAM: hypothetical protein B566_EDAN015876 [Ephemera danica]|nr:hypothetical protein B566_EDAN015876 [Ephemera danica]
MNSLRMSTTAGSMFLPKPKSGATSIDADGKVVKVEVREDEEQGIKLQEIIELLVAAGYFRARIKGLTPFDKVVGGLVWCIENCNVDVDVDLLFQENLTIGQRISLTEKIVGVLPAMGCPHSIEPHQIQGLDCIHIFPVIQWLVKRSLETRQEMGAQIRALAVSQFARLFPKLQQQQNKQQNASAAVMQVMETYAPVRKYRRRGAAPTDERSRVQSTLLEYGHMRPVQVSEASGDSSPDDQSQEVAQGTNKQEEGSRIAANIVGNIVSLRAGEIAQAAELYAEKSEELANQASPGGEGQSLARQATVLTRRKENLEAEVAKLVQQESQYKADIEATQKRISDAKTAQEELQQNLGMLSDIQGTANKGYLKVNYVSVSAKHKETKQYYTFYNTLHDTQLYLNKELTLLNSIQDNYARRTLLTLVEQQRSYVAAVTQLTAECRHNEALLAQLRAISEPTRQ